MLNAIRDTNRDTDMSFRSQKHSSVDDDGYMAGISAQMGISAADAATAIEAPEVVTAWDRGRVSREGP